LLRSLLFLQSLSVCGFLTCEFLCAPLLLQSLSVCGFLTGEFLCAPLLL